MEQCIKSKKEIDESNLENDYMDEHVPMENLNHLSAEKQIKPKFMLEDLIVGNKLKFDNYISPKNINNLNFLDNRWSFANGINSINNNNISKKIQTDDIWIHKTESTPDFNVLDNEIKFDKIDHKWSIGKVDSSKKNRENDKEKNRNTILTEENKSVKIGNNEYNLTTKKSREFP